MRFCFTLLLCLGFTIAIKSQPLSSKAEVSILTCSPGNELNSYFGHSAIRVKDTERNIDYVFNYGTFDFSTKNFYWKFARGKLNYFLSVSYFKDFKQVYLVENRSIYEQKLNLSYPEKNKIYEALLKNYQPKNRYYLYDFFEDNCATRVRDIFEDNISKKIHYNYGYDNGEQTYFDLLSIYLKNAPWYKLGILLALGAKAHETAQPFDKMFLPDFIKYSYEGATYNSTSLAKPVHTIFLAKESSNAFPWYLSPVFVFSFLLALILFLKVKRRRTHFLDIAILFLAGLIGIIIVFLWFFTDHTATKWNYNILWALPTHLVVAILLMCRVKIGWMKIYCKTSMALTLLFIIFYFKNIVVSLAIFLVILLVSFISVNFRDFAKTDNR